MKTARDVRAKREHKPTRRVDADNVTALDGQSSLCADVDVNPIAAHEQIQAGRRGMTTAQARGGAAPPLAQKRHGHAVATELNTSGNTVAASSPTGAAAAAAARTQRKLSKNDGIPSAASEAMKRSHKAKQAKNNNKGSPPSLENLRVGNTRIRHVRMHTASSIEKRAGSTASRNRLVVSKRRVAEQEVVHAALAARACFERLQHLRSLDVTIR